MALIYGNKRTISITFYTHMLRIKTQEPSCRNEIQEGLGINTMHRIGRMQSNIYSPWARRGHHAPPKGSPGVVWYCSLDPPDLESRC